MIRALYCQYFYQNLKPLNFLNHLEFLFFKIIFYYIIISNIFSLKKRQKTLLNYVKIFSILCSNLITLSFRLLYTNLDISQYEQFLIDIVINDSCTFSGIPRKSERLV